jgi:hypothetical protein
MVRHNNYVLYVTSDWCDYCCVYERELNNLKPLLKDKLLDDEEIPIIQLQSNVHKTAMKAMQISLWKVPSVYFVR